jgi:hypothetical protein
VKDWRDLPVRVAIDPNMRTADGYVPAMRDGLPDSLAVGDELIVFEPEAKIRALARVVRIRHRTVLLDVDWDTLRREPEAPVIGEAANNAPVALAA